MQFNPLLVSLVISSMAAHQDHRDDFVLLHEGGTQVIAVRFGPSAGGGVSGVISLLGTDLPFRGTRSGNAVSFTTVAPNGASGSWQATIAGDQMTLTMTNESGTERHVLTRRGVGWSDRTPLARQWTEGLVGRSWTQSEGSSSSSGSFTSQRTVSFCREGLAVYSEASAVSVTVPGLSGSRTGRDAERGRWRVITRDGVAALELSSTDQGTIQFGIRAAGDDTIYLAEQLVRLGAGAAC